MNKLDLDNPIHVAIKELIDNGLAIMYQNDDTRDTMLALTSEGEKFTNETLGEYDDMFNDEDIEISEKDLERCEKDLTTLF